jgi:MFS family permease
LVTYSEIAINVGIVLGFASGLLLTPITTNGNGLEKWRVMIACGAILPVVMILLVLCHALPESPRWLLQKGRIEEAQQVLAQVHDCPADHVMVRAMVREIQTSIEREQEAAHQSIGLFTLLARPSLRRVLFIGVGTAVAQQVVGIDAIQNYLLDVIDHAASSAAGGASSEETTTQSVTLISLGMLKLVFIMVGGSLFDTMGRRPLFLASVTGMAVALLLISLAFCFSDDSSSTWSHRAIIGGLAFYLIFFSIGMGPGAWLIPSEIFPLSIRGKAMSLATLGNRITATFMSSTFLSISTALGWSGFFFLLFVVCLIVLAFFYLYLPETKGHSLEEMTLYFAELTGDTSVLEAEERVKNHYYNNDDDGDGSTAVVVEMAQQQQQQHKSMTTGGSAFKNAPLATDGEII